MHERTNNLVVRVDEDELDMVHAVATQRDVPISQVIRTFIRDAYRVLYGTAAPPKHQRRKRGRPRAK